MTNVQRYVRGGRKLHNMSGYRCLHLPHIASGDAFQPTGLIAFVAQISLVAHLSGSRSGVNAEVRCPYSKCCLEVLGVVQLLSYISTVYISHVQPGFISTCLNYYLKNQSVGQRSVR